MNVHVFYICKMHLNGMLLLLNSVIMVAYLKKNGSCVTRSSGLRMEQFIYRGMFVEQYDIQLCELG